MQNTIDQLNARAAEINQQLDAGISNVFTVQNLLHELDNIQKVIKQLDKKKEKDSQ